MIKLDNTRIFYEEVKSMGFFRRLFLGRRLFSLLPEVAKEIQKFDESGESDDLNSLKQKIDILKEQLIESKVKVSELEIEIKHFNKEITRKEGETSKLQETKNQNAELISDLKSKVQILEDKKSEMTKEIKDLSGKIGKFEETKEHQQKEYDKRISNLDKRDETLESRRQQLEDEQVEKEKQRSKEMAKTWKQHEVLVEQSIKQICNKYTIDYYDKESVPFKGKPDNTVKIANEFIIFDAKSPQKDDLNNFPKYIKTQSEAIKKYVKESDVKKDLFLVVPTNTIEILDKTFYDYSKYRVYVITVDSLEPILLALRKIEDYAFAEELSPEDRESICSIIGQFAHHNKRRLQIDSFFAEESINLLKSTEKLPEDILDQSIKYEVGAKLNPPMEKRAKKIDLSKLSQSKAKLKKELELHDINTDVDSKKIESINLYDNKN